MMDGDEFTTARWMAGTAVNQLGRVRLEPCEESVGIELRRAHCRPASQRPDQAVQEPVAVEQRHDVEAAVGRLQVQPAPHRARGSHDHGMADRHHLGPARRSRRGKQVGDAVGLWLGEYAGRPRRIAAQHEAADLALREDKLDDRQAQLAADLSPDIQRRPARQQCLCAGVRDIGCHRLGRLSRVQGRGRGLA